MRDQIAFDIDKYTIVMWVEGSDLDCTDNILGGEIKVHMEFNSEFKEESLQINSASQLYLKREEDNQFDPYAIQVMHNEKPIGYIPKEDSKFISTEMDINHTEYEVKISFIVAKKDYNEIQVIL